MYLYLNFLSLDRIVDLQLVVVPSSTNMTFTFSMEVSHHSLSRCISCASEASALNNGITISMSVIYYKSKKVIDEANVSILINAEATEKPTPKPDKTVQPSAKVSSRTAFAIVIGMLAVDVFP